LNGSVRYSVTEFFRISPASHAVRFTTAGTSGLLSERRQSGDGSKLSIYPDYRAKVVEVEELLFNIFQEVTSQCIIENVEDRTCWGALPVHSSTASANRIKCQFKLTHCQSASIGHIEIDRLSKPSQHYGLKSVNWRLACRRPGLRLPLDPAISSPSQLLYGNAGSSRYCPAFWSLESIGSDLD
jgi:hypothetical protein